MKKAVPLLLLSLLVSSCAQYNYASKVKMVAFDDDITPGKSIGNIRGEDCTWTVLGQQLGGLPTVDKAFINTRKQVSGSQAAGFGSSNAHESQTLRYVNNVTTSNEGFNAYLFGKKCLVVTGVGYR